MSLTHGEILKVVNLYIGVSGGYLGDFSYRTHADFYSMYCDLDKNPYELEGTTRDRFIHILSESTPKEQAKILKGVLDKYPIECFPEKEQNQKTKIASDMQNWIIRLTQQSVINTANLDTTSEVVEKAIKDAKLLIDNSGATSGVDRIHTTLHGYLMAVCRKSGIAFERDDSLTLLFKKLKQNHPTLNQSNKRQEDINRIINSFSSALDSLNPIRNNASLSHPNEELLEEDEAILVINAAQTILDYLNRKFK